MFSVWFAYIHCWATDLFSLRFGSSLYKEKPAIIGVQSSRKSGVPLEFSRKPEWSPAELS
jgi:hypothetical protein